MITGADTKKTKKQKYVLNGMAYNHNKPYTENLVVLRRHYRGDDKPIIINSYEPRYNFLKYWRVVRKWAMVKYNMSSSDLEILLFMYDEGIWKSKDFLSATEIHTWEHGRLSRYLERGWIKIFREGKGYVGHARLYEMTTVSKRICKSVYEKLMQEEAIPENHQNNPIFKKTNDSYINRMYMRAIKAMNKKRISAREKDGSYDI